MSSRNSEYSYSQYLRYPVSDSESTRRQTRRPITDDEDMPQTQMSNQMPIQRETPNQNEMQSQAEMQQNKKEMNHNHTTTPSTGGRNATSDGSSQQQARPDTLSGLGVDPEFSRMEPSVFDPGFLQNYLMGVIGRRVRVEFLIGTNILTDRVGILDEVGISYIVLRDEAGSRIVCDLYSIKFVTVFPR